MIYSENYYSLLYDACTGRWIPVLEYTPDTHRPTHPSGNGNPNQPTPENLDHLRDILSSHSSRSTFQRKYLPSKSRHASICYTGCSSKGYIKKKKWKKVQCSRSKRPIHLWHDDMNPSDKSGVYRSALISLHVIREVQYSTIFNLSHHLISIFV